MDVAYAGASALEVIRNVRRNPGLRLEKANGSDLGSLSLACGRELANVNFLATGLSAPPSRSRRATVRVADAKGRRQTRDVRCITLPKGLPSESLLRLRLSTSDEGAFGDPGQGASLDGISPDEAIDLPSANGDLFDGRRVFVDSAPLACLTVAAFYQRLVRAGRLGEGDAVVRLVEVVMELAGHYARDPADPAGGSAIEDLPPFTSVEDIRSFAAATHGSPGVRLLRRALRHARDGSRSPMETCMWILLTMPASYGFFEFGDVGLNLAVSPTEDQRALMRHRTLTPDLLWPERLVAVEYQGLEPHSGKAAHAEDNRRMNDYQICGIRAFFVTFGDVRTVAALDALALDIAKAMRDHGFPNELRRMRRILDDGALRSLRAHHLAHLLPPVRRD